MYKPDEHLESVLHEQGIPVGFEEREEFRLATPLAASRTYTAIKQRLTVKVNLFESAIKCFDDTKEFIAHLKQSSGNQHSSRWQTLEVGDFCVIWNMANKSWSAIVLSGPWKCHVQLEYREYSLEESSEELTLQLIRALGQGLPGVGQPPDENLIEAAPAEHCKWLVPLYLHNSVGELSGDDFATVVDELGIRSGDFEHVIFTPTEATFLEQFSETIQLAAEQTGLAPEMIGAIVLTEVRGLDNIAFSWDAITELTAVNDSDSWKLWTAKWFSWGISGLVFNIAAFFGFESALEKVQERFGLDETWRDWVLSFITDDVSMGLVQRQVNTLIKLGVHEDFEELKNLPVDGQFGLRWTLGTWLDDNHKAILLAAHFLRRMADQAADYSGPRVNQLKVWVENYACGQFDLSLFEQPGSNWTPLHIAFIGWKYNTGHLDGVDEIAGIYAWGDMFLLSYSDILKEGVFDQ